MVKQNLPMFEAKQEHLKYYNYKTGRLFLEEDIVRAFTKEVQSLEKRKILKEFDVFCISNNQRGNSAIRQMLDKMIGVKKGVADYRVGGIGYLEAKRVERINKDGTIVISQQTPEQIRFMNDVSSRGEKYELFWEVHQGIDILLSWIKKAHHFTPCEDYLPKIVVRPI